MRGSCSECEGTGFVVASDGADVRRCSCARSRAGRPNLSACGVPRRYFHCTLDNYLTEKNPTLRTALRFAREFVGNFPAVQGGLLFTGSCGTGKTHLATAILRQLVLDQGTSCVFADYQDLLSRIQATFSRSGEGPSEEGILAPVLEADLLVLDDLGARRSTAWAEDTIGHVLNVRYNEERVTIITTNLLEMDTLPISSAAQRRDHVPGDNVLLSERVSERVLSRIHEMCRVVRLEGKDYRRERAHGAAQPDPNAVPMRPRGR